MLMLNNLPFIFCSYNRQPHTTGLHLVFEETLVISTVAGLYTPTISVKGFFFFHSHQFLLLVFFFLGDHHSKSVYCYNL